ncbi:MAG: hypothetical protein H6631_09925 [Anaerolineaceae bacterium]|nr:hypothetical protein [Anaerolineaceae bacterium]MCB9098489.1 hypothetical protein [Anaerolineales bacterium]
MKKHQQSTNLTRREALKTLAAVTGSLTLTQLPTEWQSPLVEVGVLPVHALASPQNPTFQIIGVTGPLGSCDAGNGTATGNIYLISANYNDTNGQIIANQARTIVTSTFPSGTSRSADIPLGPTNITGNGFTGTFNVTLCIDFEGEANVTLSMTLVNAAGLTSGADSVVISSS